VQAGCRGADDVSAAPQQADRLGAPRGAALRLNAPRDLEGRALSDNRREERVRGNGRGVSD